MFHSFHPEKQIHPTHIPDVPGFHYYVDLYHRYYMEYFQYPYGLLNVVGYWVETQLFGGVILFEQGELKNTVRRLDLNYDTTSNH